MIYILGSISYVILFRYLGKCWHVCAVDFIIRNHEFRLSCRVTKRLVSDVALLLRFSKVVRMPRNIYYILRTYLVSTHSGARNMDYIDLMSTYECACV